MDVLKAFLSYSTRDKRLAGKIKERLSSWGVDVFMAHEDLVPSSEWQDEIVKNLSSCDVFIPILTGSYRLSDWTDQESGMAISRSRVVVPLNITRNPHGFLGKYQACKINTSQLDQSCEDLVLALKNRRELRLRVQNSFIHSFVNSQGYLEANTRSELLDRFGPYDESQINEIIRGSLSNDQVYGPTATRRRLRRFFSKNERVIRKELRKRFPEQIPTDLSLEDTDNQVYDYVAKRHGEISLSQASNDLGFSVDQVMGSTRRLKRKGLLA
jgi:hypothetical protein